MATGSPDPLEHPVERAIRQAMQAGDFDDLPGEGKPIPGAGTVDDDLWWVRGWIRRHRDEDQPEPESRSS